MNQVLRRLLFIIFALLVVYFPPVVFPADAVPAEGVDCSLAASAMQSASRIRGSSGKRKVPCKRQDEAQVERYLRDTIEEKVPRERIEQEGRVYRMLGVIPLDFKYFDGMIELYTSQL